MESPSVYSKRLIYIAGATSLVALCLLLASGAQRVCASATICSASTCSVIDTTTSDFVNGTFSNTGLRNIGDGEVQLLPIGLTSPWTSDTDHPLPSPRAELAAVSFNNILYAIGGIGADHNPHSEIYSATTTLTGTITAGWTNPADNLLAPRAGAAAVLSTTQTSAILYVIGGGTNGGLPATNTIWYKTIGVGGSLSAAWNTAPLTASLPVSLTYMAAVVHDGYLYVIGGGTPAATNTIYRFQILNANGDLGAPVEDLAVPPVGLRNLAAVVGQGTSNDFLYVIGGIDNAGNSTQQVYYDYFNPDGALNVSHGWVSTSLLNALNSEGAIQINGAIHVVGGRTGGNGYASTTTQVLSTLIDPDGQLHDWGGTTGRWIITFPLDAARMLHGTVINLGGEIYVIGGYDSGGTPQSTVFHGSTAGTGSTYAPTGSYISQPLDAGGGDQFQSLDWNAIITDTTNMTLTLQYRTGSSKTALGAWTTAGNSQKSGASGITNTVAILPSLQARYLQYEAFFTTTISSTSPVLNWIQADYPSAATYPDFAITRLDAPPAFSSPPTQTQVITYYVSNKMSPLAPVRRTQNKATNPKAPTKTTQGLRVPPPPPLGKSPGKVAAPQDNPPPPTYMFWVSFYADPHPAPTFPISVTNAMTTCTDVSPSHAGLSGGPYAPFIYYNLELYKTPSPFYAQCDVPAGTNTFYAQIDTCDPVSDPTYCIHPYGYVLELDEQANPLSYLSYVDNIRSASAGSSNGGGGGSGLILYLPFIKR